MSPHAEIYEQVDAIDSVSQHRAVLKPKNDSESPFSAGALDILRAINLDQ
jgi:hypothetical protein